MKLQVRVGGLSTRIVAGFVALFALVLGAGWAVTNTIGTHAAHKAVTAEVATGARVFERFVELESQRMIEGARALSGDSVFRDAVAAPIARCSRTCSRSRASG